MSEPTELFRKYRPTSIKDVVGQREALRVLREFSQRNAFPQAMLFTGPSGCGKTTLARIVAKRLGIEGLDYCEVNAANFRGIDDVRRVQAESSSAPMKGKYRAYYFDEVHGLTADAQECFLKLLEEPPPHIYFLLATTMHKKLKATLLSRCTLIHLTAVLPADLEILINRVVAAESMSVESEVVSKIASAADGSARVALVLLNTLVGVDGAENQMKLISKADVAPAAIEIARLLYADQPCTWKDLAALLKATDEDPETVRLIILNYGRTLLLSKGQVRIHNILEEFREPLYGASAPALLASSCFRIILQSKQKSS